MKKQIQQRITKMTKGLGHWSYKRLESWGCLALRKEGLVGFINLYKYLVRGNEENGARFFSVVPTDGTRHNGYMDTK